MYQLWAGREANHLQPARFRVSGVPSHLDDAGGAGAIQAQVSEMAGVTNRGKLRLLEMVFRQEFDGGALPTNFYVALVTDAVAPTPDINTFSELTEIAAGNGYTTGGYSLTPGAVDFDVLTEDDAEDRGYIQVKDVVWLAVGGGMPSAGDGARYAVLLDDAGVVADREVLGYWDLDSSLAVSEGQVLTLADLELRLNES